MQTMSREGNKLVHLSLIHILYPGHQLAARKHLRYRELAGEEFIIMQPKGRPNDEAEEVILCYNLSLIHI